MRTLKSVLSAFTLSFVTAGALAEQPLSEYVDATGQISFPQDFRVKMAHLGSWFVPEGDASGFHDVYTQPESLTAYRQDGQFPDGAVIVKELRAAATGNYTTGAGVSHSTAALKQWFVMVKDSQNRFAANPVWGDGWGWALFTPDGGTVNQATDYQSDCLGCHIPARATDWVYTEAYPVLEE